MVVPKNATETVALKSYNDVIASTNQRGNGTQLYLKKKTYPYALKRKCIVLTM